MNSMAYRPPSSISRKDFVVDGSDAAFRRSIYALVQSVSRLLLCREAFGRELDLTPSQFAVLMSVAHGQGRDGITIRELAEHVGLAPTHVTTEVGRLEREGYAVCPACERCSVSRHRFEVARGCPARGAAAHSEFGNGVCRNPPSQP
jgi:hypothetical protein